MYIQTKKDATNKTNTRCYIKVTHTFHLVHCICILLCVMFRAPSWRLIVKK